MNIAGRKIGKNEVPFVICEVGQAHDGSLGIAHSFVDAVAKCGADAIKFQTHIAEAETTPQEPWRVEFSKEDKSRFDYWKRMEFTVEQWVQLKKHCDEKGLVFISSPFSMEAVQLLDDLNVGALKIASGETTNIPLLAAAKNTGKPVILSSGMSDWNELDRLFGQFDGYSDIALLQCTSEYPVSLDRVGLNVIGEIENRYQCVSGISDHSGSIWPALAAAALGVAIIEIHVTFSKDMFGPDASASLDFLQLSSLIEGVKAFHEMITNPVDKDKISKDFLELRSIFNKSLVASRDIEIGTILKASDIAVKKPGNGISPDNLADLVGKMTRGKLQKNHIFDWSDFEK